MALVAATAGCLFGPASMAQPAQGSAPALFTVNAEEGERAVSYFGEPAQEGRIQLTAWNGFFDQGAFVAHNPSPAPDAEQPFITKHFEYLQVAKGRRKGGANADSARWHIWTADAGALEVAVFLTVPDPEADAAWTITCGEQTYSVKAKASNGDRPQGWKLRIPVGKGRHTIALAPLDPSAVAATKIHRLELSGAVAASAKLLRVRWRPAAVHTGYASSTCESSNLWVFESKSLNEASSYSPINTPFGYFGTTFDASRESPRGFNFSMWATAKGKEAPPLTSMPHLLATGNPDADFSGFGHEGSGVKLRGWDCLDWNPTSVVQALRIERNGDRDHYYGYFYHGPKAQWILYAAGARPPRRKNAASHGFSKVTSFCEVPGPPQRQRTGDVERRLARRGWFLGPNGSWHVADIHTCNDKQPASSRRIARGEDGWHISLAGGIEINESPARLELKSSPQAAPPEFLAPDKFEQLFHVPVRFQGRSAQNVERGSATIQYELGGLGPNASAKLYYGPVDCVTFVGRELHGTEKKGASADFYTSDRTWSYETPAQPAKDGKMRFRLTDLTPDTQYFYRAFVTHAEGKSWSFETGTFTTRR